MRYRVFFMAYFLSLSTVYAYNFKTISAPDSKLEIVVKSDLKDAYPNGKIGYGFCVSDADLEAHSHYADCMSRCWTPFCVLTCNSAYVAEQSKLHKECEKRSGHDGDGNGTIGAKSSSPLVTVFTNNKIQNLLFTFDSNFEDFKSMIEYLDEVP